MTFHRSSDVDESTVTTGLAATVSPDNNRQQYLHPADVVREKLRLALQIVGKNAALLVHPSHSLTFERLTVILREISIAIAEINQARLLEKGVGSPVPKISSEDKDSMERIVEFGVSVAVRMLVAMQDEEFSRDKRSTTYDVFLSYPGEEGFLYAPLLYKELEEALSKTSSRTPKIFMDKEELQTGDPSSVNSPDVMLRGVLTARVLLFVFTYHSVQKEWPVMEFLCGLARLIHDGQKPPIVIDAMPGAAWLSSPEGRKADPASWVDDVKELFPIIFPPAAIVKSKRAGLEHIKEIVESTVRSASTRRRDAVSKPSAAYARKENPAFMFWGKLHEKRITEEQCKESLYEGTGQQRRLRQDGSFAVRGRDSANDDFHISKDGAERELAKVLYVMNRKPPTSLYWFYNSDNGRYVLVPNRQDCATDEEFDSLEEILTKYKLFHFCGHDYHEMEVKWFLERASGNASAASRTMSET